jgi:hypothetical protein
MEGFEPTRLTTFETLNGPSPTIWRYKHLASNKITALERLARLPADDV